MNCSDVIQGVRLMRFEDVYGQLQPRRLSCQDAAQLLGALVSALYQMRGP